MTPPDPSHSRILVDVDGIVLEQVADWLPWTPESPPPPIAGQDPLPLMSLDTGAGGTPPSIVATGRVSSDSGAARLATTVAAIILECLSGRRAMPHLRTLCTEEAFEQLHEWPRGPAWTRAALVSSPHAGVNDGVVDAVVTLDVSTRRLAMGLRLERRPQGWLVSEARLVASPGLTALLGASRPVPLRRPSARGSA
ncbi:MAG: Rv3235 family protein [Acidipropionibacterium acidipropionici]|jgi:hypothetical protein|uniref:Uncharacterized protein n=1 Tax=Acidipropionibacterium acidipropionici (strain ATCC 4875 / DSM 20272 / JCM 6432 / NBRC 12425 / NCIMB 8070 / 4) TaxID=1171373 RepID=K7SKN3_ACIA4|nr:Rv3235 family protein [Acidipropionibacterium acidipropionici]AFV89815.1 hypothetical protein PACID_20200 [Acidipropionibacterium acidipropionici ATCC 4875]ALN15828.1 hypothetical protein ASQ49_11795 [Acidipropionibacterium acidipropionici]APZ08429.1 hypothetical protein BWX38_03110 [Acidipropionibacterium acidipropionici]MDN6556948.1 Rv3235 family protein [Acidipropionibacterium acidipropionici]